MLLAVKLFSVTTLLFDGDAAVGGGMFILPAWQLSSDMVWSGLVTTRYLWKLLLLYRATLKYLLRYCCTTSVISLLFAYGIRWHYGTGLRCRYILRCSLWPFCSGIVICRWHSVDRCCDVVILSLVDTVPWKPRRCCCWWNISRYGGNHYRYWRWLLVLRATCGYTIYVTFIWCHALHCCDDIDGNLNVTGECICGMAEVAFDATVALRLPFDRWRVCLFCWCDGDAGWRYILCTFGKHCYSGGGGTRRYLLFHCHYLCLSVDGHAYISLRLCIEREAQRWSLPLYRLAFDVSAIRTLRCYDFRPSWRSSWRRSSDGVETYGVCCSAWRCRCWWWYYDRPDLVLVKAVVTTVVLLTVVPGEAFLFIVEGVGHPSLVTLRFLRRCHCTRCLSTFMLPRAACLPHLHRYASPRCRCILTI